MTGQGDTRPSVTIIIPVMDRAEQLRSSLPSLLGQSYPNYEVCIIDHESTDDIEGVLQQFQSRSLKSMVVARPSVWSPSVARNIGVRYTFSDLVFFLNADNHFTDEDCLDSIIRDFLSEKGADPAWFQRWRSEVSLRPLKQADILSNSRFPRVFCHTLGLPLLVEREVFQQIGGFNEDLQDWGYEDTDVVGRLELSGLSRIEIDCILQREHGDELRLRHFRIKDKEHTWLRNRVICDFTVRAFGPIVPIREKPGFAAWVEIDGVRYPGSSAPQQDWIMRQPVGTNLKAWVSRRGGAFWTWAFEGSRVRAYRLLTKFRSKVKC